MKTLLTTLLLLSGLPLLRAQSAQTGRQSPTVYFVLTDSTLVSGRVLRQDSSMVVVRKRNGDITYLETYQIARRLANPPARTGPPDQPGDGLTSFSLKDGSVVNGRIVRRTPVAVVVRQQNGTQTYIDPGDILRTKTMTETPPPPGGNAAVVSAENGPVALAGIPYLLNSRLAFTPRAGQLYYRNTYLIRNELEAGLTNGWSVGVSINPLLTTLYKTSEYLDNAIYINADFGTQLYTRIGIPLGRKIRLGGVLSAQLQRPEFAPATFIRYQGQVLATFGEPRSNFTLGYTFRLGKNSPYLLTDGTLTIGTVQALSPTLSIISDNSITVRSPYDQFARFAVALRIHRRYHAFDLGALSSVSQRYSSYPSGNAIQFNVYPYLGYNVQFGRKE